MNEVGLKSMSDSSFNKDSLKKQFNSQYSIIPESKISNHNVYKVAHAETKEIVNLKKAVNYLERNISYIQNEHSQMLNSLQNQIEMLREHNQELQFQLVMHSGFNVDCADSNFQISAPKSDYHLLKDGNLNSPSNQILKLKDALEVEKAKNSDLILKLGIVTIEKEEVGREMSDVDQISNQDIIGQNRISAQIDISPNIRISLEPLTLSLFHEDSGKYITNPSPSLEDCEIIIRALLENSQYPSFKTSGGSSLRSLSAQRPLIPYIRRPLHNVKPISRNSAPIKYKPPRGPSSSIPFDLASNNQKLAPIISHKNDIIKLVDESQRLSTSTKSERDYKPVSVNTMTGDIKSGYSLPALPKPNDFNQAEKQRRLHLLQRKRLDQYNNKL